MSDAGAPESARATDRAVEAARGGYERVRAQFEGTAVAEPTAEHVDPRDTLYRLTLTSVHRAALVGAGAAVPAYTGLIVPDQEATDVDAVHRGPLLLRRIEVEEYDFDVATGRVAGVLWFDRPIPVPDVLPKEIVKVPEPETRERLPVLPVDELSVAGWSGFGSWWSLIPFDLGLVLLAVVLTIVVWSNRGADRGAVMALAGLLVLLGVSRAAAKDR